MAPSFLVVVLLVLATVAPLRGMEPPPLEPAQPREFQAGSFSRASFRYKYVLHSGQIMDTKHGTAVTVAATSHVSDTALQKACLIVSHMVKHMPTDVFNGVASSHGVGLFSKAESLTVYPEYAQYADTPACHGTCAGSCKSSCTFDGRKYNSLGGLTGSRSVVLDDNVLCDAQDPHHHTQNTLVHEFGHLVNHYMPTQWKNEITAAYNHAKSVGLWNTHQYAMATSGEYWGEGTASWFLSTIRTDVTDGLNMCGTQHVCSSELQARDYIHHHDPALYRVLSYAYTNNQPQLGGDLKQCV